MLRKLVLFAYNNKYNNFKICALAIMVSILLWNKVVNLNVFHQFKLQEVVFLLFKLRIVYNNRGTPIRKVVSL